MYYQRISMEIETKLMHEASIMPADSLNPGGISYMV